MYWRLTPISYLPCLGLTWGHKSHKNWLPRTPSEHWRNCCDALWNLIFRHSHLWMGHYPIKSRHIHTGTACDLIFVCCGVQLPVEIARSSWLLSDPRPSAVTWGSGWSCCSSLFSSQLHIHETAQQELIAQKVLWRNFFKITLEPSAFRARILKWFDFSGLSFHN